MCATPIMLWFFRSGTPFYCGLWGVVNTHQIPSFAQFFLNSFHMYSPPLSLLISFTFLPIYFSTIALNSNNLEKVSSFFCMKKTQHFHEMSSINMKKFVSSSGCCRERSIDIKMDSFKDYMFCHVPIMESGFCVLH